MQFPKIHSHHIIVETRLKLLNQSVLLDINVFHLETLNSSAMLYDSDDSDITQPLSAYIWNLISLCTVKKVIDSVKHISTLIGIDNELPLKSPLLCQIKTQAQRWEKDLGDFLDSSCSLTEQIRSSSSNESSNSSSLRQVLAK